MKLVTVGVSPKVAIPAIALLVVGVVLLVVGLLVGDDTLRDGGLFLIGSSGLVGGVGYQAGPGDVRTVAGALPPAQEEVAAAGA